MLDLQDAALCYPEPMTHPQVKNHVTFIKGVVVKVLSPSLLPPPSPLSSRDGSSLKPQPNACGSE